VPAELEALERSGVPAVRVAEDDLSLFGDEELIREEKREALRRDSDDRKAAWEIHQEKRASLVLDRHERILLGRLLIFALFVSAVVVGVGLLRESNELARDGLVALTTACGAFFYRVLLQRKSS
jgi:hypothetical protein